MVVYLINKQCADFALGLYENNKEDKLVFMFDGVYLKPGQIAEGKEIYFLEKDVRKRNLSDLPENIKLISYDELIDMMESEPVYNFV
ncbi:MAG: DsrH/TusB family sulfur metabolism protein [Vulcanimicrobiota bacterium]